MPPAIPIIASLAAEAAGALGGTAAATGLGLGSTALDLGALGTVTGADIGAGLGGGLASGLTTGLMTNNPTAGLISGVTGAIGGPGVAQGASNLASGVGLNLGTANPATAAAPAGTIADPATAPAGIPPTATAGGATAVGAAPPLGVAPTDPTATGVLNQISPSGGINPFTGASAGPVTVPNVSSSAAPVTPAASAPAAAPAGTAVTAPNTIEQMVKDPSLGNAWNVLKANPSAVAGALGLGYQMMNQGSVPGLAQMQAAASQAGRTSQELQSYINTGNLPPGFQAAMDQAKQAAKAQVRSKYASLGMSGSTAESQDLANVDVKAVAAQADVAANLLKSGIDESNVSAQLLAEITGINQQQDALTSQAIANFAAAMGGTPIYRVG